MTTEALHERLRGIRGRWDQALADLQEVSGGLEAITKTPGENDLVAIAKHFGRDPKVFAIGMFDAVIMLKALTTVLEMTEPMLKKILPFTVEEHLEVQDEVLHRLLDHVEAQPQSKRRRWGGFRAALFIWGYALTLSIDSATAWSIVSNGRRIVWCP